MTSEYLQKAAEFLQAGQLGEAEPLLREYLAQFSDDIPALNYYSFVLAKLGRIEEAVGYAKKAVDLQPENVDLLANLSLVLCYGKLWNEGETIARMALALNPEHRNAADFLGRALLNQNKPAEALEWFRKADLGEAPNAELEFRVGTAHLMLNQLDEAEKHLRRAVELHSPYPDAWNNLGVTFRCMGRYREALEFYHRALEIKSEYSDAHLNRAVTWLQLGNFEQGWMEFEWRFLSHSLLLEKFTQPLWDGTSFEGKSLLIFAEQGFGDVIQLARFFPKVKEKGGTVIVQCQPELKRWLEGHPGVDSLIARGEQKPPFDLQLPIFSLPRVFKTQLETIPPVVNHFKDITLSVLPEEKGDAFKIGIAWSGSQRHSDDSARSCKLEYFQNLQNIPKVRLYSLQKDFQGTLPSGIFDAVQDCRDFYDTARVIQRLDLIICVDTAVAHLAGTLGKPVWLLTAIPPDWRWLIDRTDSPWYPSLRIFRQQKRGDWTELFNRVQTELSLIQ